jgi:hypothetical protein
MFFDNFLVYFHLSALDVANVMSSLHSPVLAPAAGIPLWA